MFASGERKHQVPLAFSHDPLPGLKAAWEECPEVVALYGPTSIFRPGARLSGGGSPNYWLRVQFRVRGKTAAQDRGNDRRILNEGLCSAPHRTYCIGWRIHDVLPAAASTCGA